MDLTNTSFPKGEWKLEYIKEKDRYVITTKYGDFIGEIGPTLVAFWLVAVYNEITRGNR